MAWGRHVAREDDRLAEGELRVDHDARVLGVGMPADRILAGIEFDTFQQRGENDVGEDGLAFAEVGQGFYTVLLKVPQEYRLAIGEKPRMGQRIIAFEVVT